MVEPLPAAAGFPQAIRGRALVCFAVKEEARFFSAPETEILISGMGCSNAERAVNKALRERSYDLVLSCGFAGGLNPALRVGTVLFEADEGAGLTPHLLAAGAMAANFHFADRVAITAAEK